MPLFFGQIRAWHLVGSTSRNWHREHSRGRDFAGGRARGALFAGCWGDEEGGVCFVFFKNLGFGSSSDTRESDVKNGV